MKTAFIVGLVVAGGFGVEALRFPPSSSSSHCRSRHGSLASSTNSDVFGGSSSGDLNTSSGSLMPSKSSKLMEEAKKLRQEAEELEIKMREEARAKGLPEEMINKMIPLRTKAAVGTTSPSQSSEQNPSTTVLLEKKKVMTADEVRSTLGYLNAGDAVRMTSELDRIKAKGALQLWNSKDFSSEIFTVNNYQLKAKCNIEPAQLKLDDVGFKYQNVLIVAIVVGTVCGLGSSFIGGQLGFILGYLSALVPVTLVGVGSIAPALIGDVLNNIGYATDAAARERYVHSNAGKFLVGYVAGLPVARFSAGGPSNTCEFFQLRPSGKGPDGDKKYFESSKFKQVDIARSSAVSIAGSVAECIKFGEASGKNPGDVNTLYELMNAVDPVLSPEKVQDHIRWSAVAAYDILKAHPKEYERLVEAFASGAPLEECIACIESA